MADGVWITREGSPEPLGASLAPGGVNFAVWSSCATAIEVCLFDSDGEHETARIALPARTGDVFHGVIEGLGPGALYGLRVHGPFAPARGERCDPDKLLIDPYALALDRTARLDPSMFSQRTEEPADSGAVMPKAVVADVAGWPAPPTLAIPWGETVIYELHVRGFTMRHPDVPEALRGTFAGLAHPAAIAHLKRLGVTSVEVMPCAAWIDERHLPPLGLTNYWGYNPIALMAPDPRLAPGGWGEVRAAVGALAEAGVETIVDVVLNHTGEGDGLGPTLSMRGLDNAAYYRLRADDLARYVDDAGTGNVLALDRPAPLRLAMDALRAWRRLGGVAGFRFDLASVMGRRTDGFEPTAPLLAAIGQDPELRTLKLIAEPWDIGRGGYQLGAFPASWSEWNDRWRDTMRGFWRGEPVCLGELARRLAGSEDVFTHRRPSRSINYVVAHDGFTLADLVSYAGKHNEPNGEDNRDGTDDNRSWNNGVEGPSEDPAVRAARLADQRALLACLLLGRGTPMLTMGAESGHSQAGDNNAYSQDNAISWLDWAGADHGLADFTARLIAIRRDHPAFHADRFLHGEPGAAGPYPDVTWRRADGEPLDIADWDRPDGESLVVFLNAPDGTGIDRVALAIHRGAGPTQVALPEPRDGYAWSLLADSADPARTGEAGSALTIAPRSVLSLAEIATPGRAPRSADPRGQRRLAAAAGIASEWWDAHGERRSISPDTERAVLAAMGLPAESSHRALESLQHLAQTHDRRPLPFALCARVGEPIAIPLGFPRGAPVPRTWLAIEDEAGGGARLRACAETGRIRSLTGRDEATSGALDILLPPMATGRFRVRREDRPDVVCHLTIAPTACHMPQALAHPRIGLSAQLYGVRRPGDQGIGDFTTLGILGEAAARVGAAVLAINPTPMLFPALRELASPYYPSDRRFLDPIWLDLTAPPIAAALPPEATGLAAAPTIDYPAVWALKAAVLELAFAVHGEDADFVAYAAAAAPALLRFIHFQVIAEARKGESWARWPAGLRDPDGAGVACFARANAMRVRFHLFLQWLCERQFAAAADRAGGLTLGFCRDLAVGCAPDGAEAWAEAGLMTRSVSIGAPPDLLGPLGQVWGLPPFDPRKLAEDGFRAPAALFAASMRHAGALRIDHVMGLDRQFWVPEGAAAADGAYVGFPLEHLLAELALESERAQCLVIGEDLGTVEPGLRERLAKDQLLSYRVLPFEREGAVFKQPTQYPALGWACVATHDLPPLEGWWSGADIDERLGLGLIDADGAAAARGERAGDRAALITALVGEGLIEADEARAEAPLDDALAGVIHAFIARSHALLAVAQVEDLAGAVEAVNLPGTDRERPNWRLRLPVTIDELFAAPRARAILAAMRAGRPGG